MARIRTIKPEFFKNEDLAELPMSVRLLFIGLWTQADREGRLEDRPKRIKAELFPYEEIDIEKMLNDLNLIKFILRYQINGKSYIQIIGFSKHQIPHYKEVPSNIPPYSEEFIGSVTAKPLTQLERQFIFERDGEVCKKCGVIDDLTIDHIEPISKGGTKDPSNLQVLCRKCNSSKNNRVNVDPTLGSSCLQERKGKEGEQEQEGNGKEYARDIFFENGVLKFFGFSEMSFHYQQQKILLECCRAQYSRKEFEYFKNQCIDYRNYIELIGVKFKKNFADFLGKQSECFQDGFWRSENWSQKIIERQQQSSNGRGATAVIAASQQPIQRIKK